MSARRGRRVVPALLLAALAGGCGGGGGGGEEPAREEYTPEELERLMEIDPVVNEYFHLRKRAMLDGDAEVLWERFPALRQPGPPGSGINAEGQRAAGWGETDVLDGDILAETDDRFRLELGADTVALQVRGREMYLRPDFRQSGWGLEMTLVLRRGADGWEVVRTDEVTEMERHADRE